MFQISDQPCYSVNISTIESKLEAANTQIAAQAKAVKACVSNVGGLEDQVEYLENQSPRNNIQINGVAGQENETWEKSEELVKELVKEKLEPTGNLEIERAQSVGKKRSHDQARPDGSSYGPRPIVAKFVCWKQCEMIVASAQQKHPEDKLVTRDKPLRRKYDNSAVADEDNEETEIPSHSQNDGVALYVKSDLIPMPRLDLSKDSSDFEAVLVEVENKNVTFLIEMEADESGENERPNENLALMHMLSAMQKSMTETTKLLLELKQDKNVPARSQATMSSESGQLLFASDEADRPASEKAQQPASEEATAHASDEGINQSSEDGLLLAGSPPRTSQDDAISIFGGND
eukprot:gene2193-2496_t